MSSPVSITPVLLVLFMSIQETIAYFTVLEIILLFSTENFFFFFF